MLATGGLIDLLFGYDAAVNEAPDMPADAADGLHQSVASHQGLQQASPVWPAPMRQRCCITYWWLWVLLWHTPAIMSCMVSLSAGRS